MNSDEYTLDEKQISVGDGHELYAHLWGAKNSPETIVFLHGGPGGSVSDSNKTLFNPEKQKVLFFDQRGCGKSTPYGSLHKNTTQDLIEDIQKLCDYFGIKNIVLTGNSWGSCLALAYALKYPENVARMLIRGIFTAREQEINFLLSGGWRAFFPDAWQNFVENVPEKYQANPAEYHLPRVLGEDPEAAKKSAFELLKLEGSVVKLDDRTPPLNYEEFDPAGIIIEAYYMQNKCFLPEGYILENVKKLAMPIHLIQGRYDAVCPPYTAYELHQKLPNAQLHWTLSGHAGSDRENWQLAKTLLAQ